ncbi:MAG: MFS transporter [Candidatus Heimdallarchaeota archaeon]|nr:MFS transporter [Candidatus Heimdallarchaeota archaeon]
MNLTKNQQDSGLKALYLASFISVTGFSIIIPFFPLYLNDILNPIHFGWITLGIALQIGIITAASKFIQLLLNPAFGELSDNVGRKPLIVLGMLLYAIIMSLYGLMTSFLGFVLLRLIQGIATASVWVLGEALVADLSEEDQSGRNLGKYMLSMLAGTTLGPFIGYFVYTGFTSQSIAEDLAFRFTFMVVGIISLCCLIIILKYVHDPKKNSGYIDAVKAIVWVIIRSPAVLRKILKSEDYNRNRRHYSIYTIAFTNGMGSALLLPIMVLFLEDYYLLDPASITLIIAVISLISLVGAPIGGLLSDKLKKKNVVFGSAVGVAIVMPLLGIQIGTTIIFLIVQFLILKVFFSAMQPAFRSLQVDYFDEIHRGKEFGIVQANFNLGSTVGPIFGGVLYDLSYKKNIELSSTITILGAEMVFLLSSILILLGGVVLFLGLRTSASNVTLDQI